MIANKQKSKKKKDKRTKRRKQYINTEKIFIGNALCLGFVLLALMSEKVDENSLQQTATWAVAVVCVVLLVISIVIEKLIHKVGSVSPFSLLLDSLFLLLALFLSLFSSYLSSKKNSNFITQTKINLCVWVGFTVLLCF